MSRPTAISPEEQEQTARRIGVLLLQAAPENWQQVTVEYRATGEYRDLLGEVTTAEGSAHPWEPPEELHGIFEQLRDGMYRPDVGTWLSALYVVERPSSYRIDINFDSEPQWRQPLPRAAYADELRRYPRTEDNVPEWMREKLESGHTAPAEPAPAVANGPPPAPVLRVAEVFEGRDEQGRPVIAQRNPVPPGEIGPLRQYLETAPTVHSTESTPDELDPDSGAPVPPTWHTDGTWVWSGAVPYYLAQYGVPPQDELIEHARERGFALPEVDNATQHAAADLVAATTPAPQAPETPDERTPPEPEPSSSDAGVGAAVGATAVGATAVGGAAAVGVAATSPDEERADEVVPETAASPERDATDDRFETYDSAAPAEVAPVVADEPAADQAVAPSHDQPENETEEAFARLHDKLTEHAVPADSYRLGSHDPHAWSLLREDIDWVVVGPADNPGEVRFARPAQAAAFLLGSVLMALSASTRGLSSAPEVDVVDEGVADRPVERETVAPPPHVEEPTPVADSPDPVTGVAPAAVAATGAAAVSAPDHEAEQLSGAPSAEAVSEAPVSEAHLSEAPVSEASAVAAPAVDTPGVEAAGDTPDVDGPVATPEPEELPDESGSTPEPLSDDQDQDHGGGLAGLPRRAPEPEQSGGHFLFTANQAAPESAPAQNGSVPGGGPDVPSEHTVRDVPASEAARPPQDRPTPDGSDDTTRRQAPPRFDSEQHGPGGTPAGPGGLPKRPPRGERPQGPQPHAPADRPGGPGPAGAADRRPGPSGPGMGAPPRPGAVPPGAAPQRPPQGAPPPQAQQGAPPQAQQPVGNPQQIQPMQGEPPLTLYRDRRAIVLQPGTDIDRFGDAAGNVTYAIQTPYSRRSLPPQWSSRPYHAFRVQRPVHVLRGTAVPWFEQPGGGTAFVLPGALADLIADGTLTELQGGEVQRPPMD